MACVIKEFDILTINGLQIMHNLAAKLINVIVEDTRKIFFNTKRLQTTANEERRIFASLRMKSEE